MIRMTKTWLITIMLFIIIIVLSFLKLIPHNLFNEDIHINCQDNTMTITGDGLLTKQDIDNYFINSIYQKNTIVNVVVENGIDEIGYRCFENFENLQKITLDNSIFSIDAYAFYRCFSLQEIILPENLTQIDDGVFMECSALEKIHLGKNVNFIAENVFENCLSLEEINFDEQNSYYASKDGVLYNSSLEKLILYPYAKQTSTYTVPS